MKNRKAPGPDDKHKLIKYGGKALADLFQRIIDNRTIPNDWKRSITTSVFKNGDKKTTRKL